MLLNEHNIRVVIETQQRHDMNASHDSFASFFRALRKDRRITLRAFCLRAEADPGNTSRMERGAIPPPQDREILTRYAKALGIEEGGDDWYTFFDLAAADRGIIPHDIMEDENLVKELPAFFRTLRGQKPTEAEMRTVIDKVRKS
jgi:transcriptional regulator with XRE-family HTH domain